MKKTTLFLIVLTFLITNQHIYGQHKISAYAGWSASKIQIDLSPDVQKGPTFNEFFALPIFHSPYAAFEYEYDWKRLRFSTGLSVGTWGASEFFGDHLPFAEMYLNIPIIAGGRFLLPKEWGLTIEGGVELGMRLTNIGIYFIDDYDFKFRGNINAVVGLEADWKRFRFGTRLQIGLSTFRYWNADIGFRHSAITTYIGYTLFDSVESKKKLAKRLAKKRANSSNELLEISQ